MGFPYFFGIVCCTVLPFLTPDVLDSNLEIQPPKGDFQKPFFIRVVPLQFHGFNDC